MQFTGLKLLLKRADDLADIGSGHGIMGSAIANQLAKEVTEGAAKIAPVAKGLAKASPVLWAAGNVADAAQFARQPLKNTERLINSSPYRANISYPSIAMYGVRSGLSAPSYIGAAGVAGAQTAGNLYSAARGLGLPTLYRYLTKGSTK